MELQKRKANRLQYYDYSSDGAYFVTVCTKNREKIFWDTVGEDIILPQGRDEINIVGEDIILPQSTNNAYDVGEDIILPQPLLSQLGKIVERAIIAIPEHYQNVRLLDYVVMPNHIHMVLLFSDDIGRMISSPTKSLSTIVGQFKRSASKAAGVPLWQRSFYDHVIRDEKDYLKIAEYIVTNPIKWADDCYY